MGHDMNVDELDDRENEGHAAGEDQRRDAVEWYLDSRRMTSGRDKTGPIPTHRSYATGEYKRIDYIFATEELDLVKYDTMEDLAGRSDHFPIQAVYMIKGAAQRGKQEEWGMRRGWRPRSEPLFQELKRRSVQEEAQSFDDFILSSEVTARAETLMTRESSHPAKDEARRLLRLRRAASSSEARLKICRDLHAARREAKQQRVERGRVSATRSGRVRSWREVQRAPQTIPKTFEKSKNIEDWPELLRQSAHRAMAAAPGLEAEWDNLLKEYLRMPDEPDERFREVTAELRDQELSRMRLSTLR